jgi:hypothetical protein
MNFVSLSEQDPLEWPKEIAFPSETTSSWMQQDSSFQGIETPLTDLSDEEFDNGGLL